MDWNLALAPWVGTGKVGFVSFHMGLGAAAGDPGELGTVGFQSWGCGPGFRCSRQCPATETLLLPVPSGPGVHLRTKVGAVPP